LVSNKEHLLLRGTFTRWMCMCIHVCSTIMINECKGTYCYFVLVYIYINLFSVARYTVIIINVFSPCNAIHLNGIGITVCLIKYM
jgi:hypothetical protein